MTVSPARAKAPPRTATSALVAAAINAAASAGVALFRSADGAAAEAGPHGSVRPDEPVAPVEQKIAELEARLKADPGDAEGWGCSAGPGSRWAT